MDEKTKALGAELNDGLGRKRWFFSWTNFSGSETKCLILEDRTKTEAYKVAMAMGWKPIRWWQWWRWMNDDNYHGAA